MSDEALAQMAACLRRLATLPADAAKLGAPLVLDAAKAAARAGTSPDGKAWEPKKDGGRAMVNGADALSVTAVGPVIRLTVKGPEAWQNFGTSRIPARPLLPDGGTGVPKAFADAIEEAATKAFARALT